MASNLESNEEVSNLIEWFKENYREYPRGIEDIRVGEEGVVIELQRPFAISDFAEYVDSLDDYRVETTPNTLSVYKVERVGQNELERAYGTTFYADTEIRMGVKKPVDSNLSPIDDTASETLEMVVLYLSKRYDCLPESN